MATPVSAVGSYPDRITGNEYMEALEEKYKVKYAVGVCNALRQLDPKTFQETFGSFEECVRRAGAFADFNFDGWKVNWPTKLAASIKAFG